MQRSVGCFAGMLERFQGSNVVHATQIKLPSSVIHGPIKFPSCQQSYPSYLPYQSIASAIEAHVLARGDNSDHQVAGYCGKRPMNG